MELVCKRFWNFNLGEEIEMYINEMYINIYEMYNLYSHNKLKQKKLQIYEKFQRNISFVQKSQAANTSQVRKPLKDKASPHNIRVSSTQMIFKLVSNKLIYNIATTHIFIYSRYE